MWPGAFLFFSAVSIIVLLQLGLSDAHYVWAEVNNISIFMALRIYCVFEENYQIRNTHLDLSPLHLSAHM